MPRKSLIKQNQFPYHIINRSNNKDWYVPDMNIVWDIFLKSLKHANENYPTLIHAFVLMNNHYHLLLTTPDQNIDKFMQVFGKQFSERLKKASGHINRKFGGRYRWSIISHENYHFNVYRYIYQNPLRANITKKCEVYPYSTLYYQVHNKKLPFQIYSQLEIKEDYVLKWINTPLNSCQSEGLRRGLKHSECKISTHRLTKKIPIYDIPAEYNASYSAKECGT